MGDSCAHPLDFGDGFMGLLTGQNFPKYTPELCGLLYASNTSINPFKKIHGSVDLKQENFTV